MDDSRAGISLIVRVLGHHTGRAAPKDALEEIVSLSQMAEYVKAAETATRLLSDGVTDIRVLSAWLLGCFIAEGPRAVGAILDAMHMILTEAWPVIHPVARREPNVDAALRGLIKAIVTRWEFEAAHHGARTKAWSAADRETAAHALEASARVREAADVISDATFPAQLSNLEALVRPALERAVVAQSPEAPLPAAPREPAAAAEAAPRTPGAIEVSPAMATFIHKLRAFELLVARGDLARAAVVANDIRNVVEHFDPRVYLPRLLTRHFSLLSDHISTIAPQWEARESIEWQVLEQHYLVDIDGFIGHE